MPIDPGSNPVAMMGAQSPAMGTPAPQGAGFMASPQAGLPAPAAGSPEALMALGQMAAQVLQKQQGIKYSQDLSDKIRAILQKLQAKNMFENPAAESDLSTIIQKLGAFKEKLGKAGPSTSPALSTSLADIVQKAGSGATR